jgi:hypothetical protein
MFSFEGVSLGTLDIRVSLAPKHFFLVLKLRTRLPNGAEFACLADTLGICLDQ